MTTKNYYNMDNMNGNKHNNTFGRKVIFRSFNSVAGLKGYR